MISDAYNPQTGPNDMLNPNKCKNIRKTTTSEDKWKISVAKKAANKLKVKIDRPTNIRDLLPNLSSKNELIKVKMT